MRCLKRRIQQAHHSAKMKRQPWLYFEIIRRQPKLYFKSWPSRETRSMDAMRSLSSWDQESTRVVCRASLRENAKHDCNIQNHQANGQESTRVVCKARRQELRNARCRQCSWYEKRTQVQAQVQPAANAIPTSPNKSV